MSEHVNISPQKAADRLAIRELVEAEAHGVRDPRRLSFEPTQ
jgi:hypothetical protein